MAVMMKREDGFVRVAAAVAPVRPGDPERNAASMLALMKEADEQGADLITFPALALTGATCGDLFRQQTLLRAAEKALERLIAGSAGLQVTAVAGLPLELRGAVYSAAAVIRNGKLLGFSADPAPKQESLTAYPAGDADTVPFGGEEVLLGDILYADADDARIMFAVTVGEEACGFRLQAEAAAAAGAVIVANCGAAPETVGVRARREEAAAALSRRLLIGYVSAMPGAGESVQDNIYGGHRLIAEAGKVPEAAEIGEACGLTLADIDADRLLALRRKTGMIPDDADAFMVPDALVRPTERELLRDVTRLPFLCENEEEMAARAEEILAMQAQGLASRMAHIGAKAAVLGLSGGLDSTLAVLVCARAVKHLGLPSDAVRCVTMPCFGTSDRTYQNACGLAKALGADLREIPIRDAVMQHFSDIGHDPSVHNAAFENAQARERTQILMDYANDCGGIVVGTGDLSELALGWATYNGDHMAMYGVNGSLTKTLIRAVVGHVADTAEDPALAALLRDILDTPVSPELLPAEDGRQQSTEGTLGPYELHDFFLYAFLHDGFGPAKTFRLACRAFEGTYEPAFIRTVMTTFFRRFFAQQFKRSCMPDGVGVGSVSLSPRGAWSMPSDAFAAAWMREIETL